MKYSKEFYLLLARLNPAMYDAIFPHYHFESGLKPATRETEIATFQTKGNPFGTDLYGDLHIPAKFTWRMNTLIQKLQIAIAQAKLQEAGSNARALGNYIADIVDDYCGNEPKKPHFPPKPRWFDNTITIEEKVSAAILMNQAAPVVKGTAFEEVFLEGADKILDSALAEFSDFRKMEMEAV